MKLLMHSCCAPCSMYPVKKLREENIDFDIFWFNPNIHPYTEYEARLNALKEYTKRENIKLIVKDDYGIKEFCKNVAEDITHRCRNYCYRVRLKALFEYAKENNYDAVTTSLLYSIYQDHNFIKSLMEEMSKEYGIDFYYQDFRKGFWEGHDMAVESGLYMQKYCGCIFSEEDRYWTKATKPASLPEGFTYPERKRVETKRVDDINAIIGYFESELDDKKLEEIKQYFSEFEIVEVNKEEKKKEKNKKENKSYKCYTLNKDNQILALAFVVDSEELEDTVLLKYFIVSKESRNKGYGTKLLKVIGDNFKNKYKNMIVETDLNNGTFFIRNGFYNFIKEIDENVYYLKKLK